MIGAEGAGRTAVGIGLGERASAVAYAPDGIAAPVGANPFVQPPVGDDTKLYLEVVAHVVMQLGLLVDATVVAVPSSLPEARRASLREAAAGVGLDLLRLLEAPKAAALGWGGLGRALVVELDARGLVVSQSEAGVVETADVTPAALGAAVAQAVAVERGVPPARLVEPATSMIEAGGTTLACTLDDGELRREITPDELAAWLAPALAPIEAAVRRVAIAGADAVVPVGGPWRLGVLRDRIGRAAALPVAAQHDPAHILALGAAVDAWGIVAGAPAVSVASLVRRYRARRD